MLTDKELEALVLMLHTHTPLVRLNWPEALTVFERMQAEGYTIKAPKIA